VLRGGGQTERAVIPAPIVSSCRLPTGAGDTFGRRRCRGCGAWTSDVDSAITFAQRAAAYSVTSLGAQASMPWLSDLD